MSAIAPKRCAHVLAALLFGLGACRESTGFEDGESESDGDGDGDGDGDESGDDGFPPADACMSSDECEDDYCVASWDGQAPRGPAECIAQCVAELDLSLFCIDDASCCEGSSCSLDGLCEPPWTGGDGDGDPGDGDGDPGDGDGDPGDGDGDGDTGDGDGDPGDGDGDPGDGDGDGG